MQNNENNACYSTSAGTDDVSQTLQWLQVHFNGTTLYHGLYLYERIFDSARYGRFDDFALIDSASRTVQFQYDTTSNKVAIIIPHFWEAAGMTPNL